MTKNGCAVKAFQCLRCGGCCSKVGQSMWLRSDHPLIERLVRVIDPGKCGEDAGKPCLMLNRDGSRATCLLQKYLGRSAKPAACRDYPADGDRCRRQDRDLAGGGQAP